MLFVFVFSCLSIDEKDTADTHGATETVETADPIDSAIVDSAVEDPDPDYRDPWPDDGVFWDNVLSVVWW